MTSAQDTEAARGILAAVLSIACKDVREGMRRARWILRKPSVVRAHNRRIKFHQVQAMHWMHKWGPAPMGFKYVVDHLDRDPEETFTRCTAGLDMRAVREALRVQFHGDRQALAAWLREAA